VRLIKWTIAMPGVAVSLVGIFVGQLSEAVFDVLTDWADR
jgi:hypothetical protein